MIFRETKQAQLAVLSEQCLLAVQSLRRSVQDDIRFVGESSVHLMIGSGRAATRYTDYENEWRGIQLSSRLTMILPLLRYLDPTLVPGSLDTVVPDAADIVDVNFAIHDRYRLATSVVWCPSTEEW